MSKKNIIIISSVAAFLIIAIVITLILVLNKKTIKIEKYNDDFEVDKTIELKDKKTVRKLYKIAKEKNLTTENVSQDMGIKNDIKVIFEDGRFFIMQFDLDNYCYYENPNTDTKIFVNMPEELLNIVTNLLEEN